MPHRFKIIEYLKQLVDNGEEKEANIVKELQSISKDPKDMRPCIKLSLIVKTQKFEATEKDRYLSVMQRG